jgi:CheY-like chemotaxis protein
MRRKNCDEGRGERGEKSDRMHEISILLIGDITRPEFRGVGEFLESLGHVHFFPDAETAADALTSGEIVTDLAVVVQSYPGEFSLDAIDRLRAASPISRIIALLGSWCEGEMRSGQPWPAVFRLYWHQGLGRIGREIGRLTRGDCPSWGLPLTVSEEERLLAQSGTDFQPDRRTGFQPVATDWESVPHRGLIGIAARRCESFDWLSATCRQRGYAALWLHGPHYPKVAGFAAILLDGTDFRGSEFDTLRQIAERYPRAKQIALMDFPRIEDRRRLLEAGVEAVLSKPISAEDLFVEVESGEWRVESGTHGI